MKIKLFLIPVIIILTLALAACPVITGTPKTGTPAAPGSLTVTVVDGVSKALLPLVDMNPASYRIVGDGPGTAAFDEPFTGSSKTIESLVPGSWDITVAAYNAESVLIGEGSDTVNVSSTGSTNSSIIVRPLEGLGTLSLSLSWPADKVTNPSIQAVLTDAAGIDRNLSVTMGTGAAAGTAQISESDIAAGYHTLAVLLLKTGSLLAAGDATIVRIVKDQTTGGTITFEIKDEPGSATDGQIKVIILQDMQDMLNVEIADKKFLKDIAQSITLTGSVGGYTGAVSWKWYVNGVAAGTDPVFVFGTEWSEGWYNIAVTGFTADKKRAGSSSFAIKVGDITSEVSLTIDGTAVGLGVPGDVIDNYGYTFNGTPGAVAVASRTDAVIAAEAGAAYTIDWVRWNTLPGNMLASFTTGPVTFDNTNNQLLVRITAYDSTIYYLVAVIKTGSDIKTLDSLTVGGVAATLGNPGTLTTGSLTTPTFSGTKGAVTIPSLENVTISAVKTDPNSTADWTSFNIDAKGNIEYAVSPVTFSDTDKDLAVRVTAENETVQHYVIEVTQQE
jgi:hypothetical protein